jgi:hypothetical protein
MSTLPRAAWAVPIPDADSAVAAMLAVMELRHPGASLHAERVAELALELTVAVDPLLAAAEGIGHAYLLHDVGKVGVPDEILVKPGVLTPVQLRVMRTHTTLGEELVRRIRFLPPLVREVVGCHHERWDGSGYPRRLVGHQIPLAARILAVADTYDAMTHDRPYRDAVPPSTRRTEALRWNPTRPGRLRNIPPTAKSRLPFTGKLTKGRSSTSKSESGTRLGQCSGVSPERTEWFWPFARGRYAVRDGDDCGRSLVLDDLDFDLFDFVHNRDCGVRRCEGRALGCWAQAKFRPT